MTIPVFHGTSWARSRGAKWQIERLRSTVLYRSVVEPMRDEPIDARSVQLGGRALPGRGEVPMISVSALRWILMPRLSRRLAFRLKPSALIDRRSNLPGVLFVVGTILFTLFLFIVLGRWA